MIGHKMNKKMRYLPELIMVILVIVLAHALVKLTWLLFEKSEPVKAEAIPSLARMSLSPDRSSQAGREIAEWDLFGALSNDSTPATNLPVQAPDTSLQLTLEGVYVASDAKNSSAIISEKGAAKRYYIGAEIQQGVSLHDVQSSHVILKRLSRFETLRFADPQLQQVPVNETASRRTTTPAVRVNRGIVNDIRSGQIRSVQDVLDNYGEHPAEQFQHFLQESGLQSTDEGGEPGLMVSSSTSSDILKTVGLMPGDILRSVNDHAITELQSNDTLMREILTSGRAKIVIQRGPRRFVISYPLPQR